jgi:hypothetical protein
MQPKPTVVHHPWVGQFHREHGRPPRVLHIGNIANNAYLNAKILRCFGIDCDVLAHDYYHIMGSPEWEDADFDAVLTNENRPEWHTIDLHGFSCPRWFAQGPFTIATEYLRASREGDITATALWHGLQVAAGRQSLPASHVSLLGRSLRAFSGFTRRVIRGVARRARRILLNVPLGDRYTARVQELCAEFRAAFPGRADVLQPSDLWMPDIIPAIPRLCRLYDFVVGYSTYGVFPLIADETPYLAFEHGTLRSIPFEPTPQGRTCALTYKLADEVLITNADVRRSAELLGLERYRFVPHPVNEDYNNLDQSAALRLDLCRRLSANFLVFHPARQHWDMQRHPSWEKGNDHFIRGFARHVRECNPAAGAVLVEWGNTLTQSKELIRSLGIENRVLWISTQPNQALGRYIRACDALADQFHLGAFGSLMPRGLFLGTPCMLYLDEEVHRWCFPEMPPVLNARCPDSVAHGLKRLREEPGLAIHLQARGRAWYDRYHSNDVIAHTWIAALQRAYANHVRRRGLKHSAALLLRSRAG